ncbi:hypothetical protein ACFKKO_02185 [Streptococcus agalactiae]
METAKNGGNVKEVMKI